MQHLTLLTLGLAATSSASLLKRQLQCSDPSSIDCQEQEAEYLQQVCQPTNATGYPDFNAPCTQAQLISIQCMYGAAGLQALLSTDDSDSSSSDSSSFDGDMPTLSNSTQRDCVCQSQFWAALGGCNDCYQAHGAAPTDGALAVDPSYLSSASSSYCAVTNTPTVGLDMMLYGIATGSLASSIESVASTASPSTFSDPIGNQTAVSLYYTPSVTGSAAWVVAEATSSASNGTAVASGSSGSGSASSTESVATSNGQIVATAGTSATTSSASGSASGTASAASGSASTTAAGSGARKQEAAAIAGVVALAGLVAFL